MTDPSSAAPLRRELGVFAAMMMGMGSIVGTGVFVSIGIGADVAGPGVVIAIMLASLVAICNGLSSAQLAANHPVSGGTYEYGYRWLRPAWGFTAGWMFLCAKSASAATAALGLAGYSLQTLGLEQPGLRVPVALLALLVLTALTLSGIRRSSTINIVIVSVTLASLCGFVMAGLPLAWAGIERNFLAAFHSADHGARELLQATALMFVAYTGYGRIATLGEEVKQPRRTIPRAVIATLIASMLLYVSVGLVAISSVGAEVFGQATQAEVAPLEVVAAEFGVPGLPLVLAVGAVTAMLGVLLNLLLGLSRVLLAMGRRGDVPASVAVISHHSGVPRVATIVVALVIAAMILCGDVRLTWSFSAFTVLVYYAVTNLCVLRLAPDQRVFPVWPAYVGLSACLGLAFWVERTIWLSGLALILVGLVWQRAYRRLTAARLSSATARSRGGST